MDTKSEVKTGMIIQSHIFHGDKRFIVSTINRRSSAAAAYGAIYAETMVWDSPIGEERGPLIAQGEGSENSIVTHMKFCKSLIETGEIVDE